MLLSFWFKTQEAFVVFTIKKWEFFLNTLGVQTVEHSDEDIDS